MKPMKHILLTLSLFFTTTLLLAWGPNGHRIVAQVCTDNLSKNARAEIKKILGNDYLTQIATWPDFIRSEKQWDFTKSWHYISVDSGRTVQQVLDSTEKIAGVDNVIEAIDLMKRILKNDAAATKYLQDLVDKNQASLLSNSIKATALAFLVHFIGDIHQPMHVGKTSDLGGNTISVLFFSDKTNLHSVWDGGIIEQQQLSFSEFAAFVNKDQMPNKKICEKDPVTLWATESILVRNKIYTALYAASIDKKTELPVLSYQYIHDFISPVEQRLGAAGFRAAYVMNELFK